MHSARSPAARTSSRRAATPVADLPSHPSQTSLPPIRSLHPFLPPSGTMMQHMASNEQPPYPYSQQQPHYASHMAQQEQIPQQQQRDQQDSYAQESEGDEYDHSGPPKKKRRRQALSCTECKRRKIKCDRSQPCAPCTRRGEQEKCQWHIVEPIEKYVTRAEYDELKTRVEALQELVQRLLPVAPAAQTVPYYQMSSQPGVTTGAPIEAVQPYNPPAAPIVYQSMMPPPQTYPQHVDTSSSQGPHRYVKPDETQSPSRHVNQSPLNTTSPILSTSHPSSSRHPGENRSPVSTAAAAKASPLSLSSITTPYNTEHQSKNFHAQTLTLGERLRLGSRAPAAPAVHTFEMTNPLQVPTNNNRTCSLNIPPLRAPLLPLSNSTLARPRAVSATLPCDPWTLPGQTNGNTTRRTGAVLAD